MMLNYVCIHLKSLNSLYICTYVCFVFSTLLLRLLRLSIINIFILFVFSTRLPHFSLFLSSYSNAPSSSGGSGGSNGSHYYAPSSSAASSGTGFYTANGGQSGMVDKYIYSCHVRIHSMHSIYIQSFIVIINN